MRVLIVNTSEKTGGAAVAANRLMDALNNNGVKAKMLVRDKETEDITVVSLPRSLRLQWNFLWERWCVSWHLHFSRQRLWEVDMATSGTDITRLREFQEADVIHLSWINQGMLSLKNIRKIIRSGKPVVWTMHDLWPATGICHYARGCNRYASACGNCPLLPNKGSKNDLSAKIFRRKKELYHRGAISFVTCSRWLERQAKGSGLFVGQIMRIASGNKINPLIGSAGVSAVPMAARVSQVVGLKDNPSNYLLMQAMGPNVAGVIGTAVAAGTMLAQFGG